MKTLTQFRNHHAVQEIILESDHGRRTYVINLKPGFATDNGGGQTSGTESTLAGVAAFLKSVAAVPVETYNSENVPAHIKTSHAAAKGFELYAARHGETAARGVCYGQLATVGFYFYAGCPDLVESELNRAAA